MTTRLITVAGATGGTGRTTLIANLATYLHRRGVQVACADFDGAHASLALHLGAREPNPVASDDLGAVLGAMAGPMPPCWTPTTQAGRDAVVAARLLKRLHAARPGVAFVDVPAGASPTALHAFARADVALLVLTPEPHAVASAHRFLRLAFVRAMVLCAETIAERRFARLLDEEARSGDVMHAGMILTRATTMGADASEAIALVERVRATFHPLLVVNRCTSSDDARLTEDFAVVTRQVCGVNAQAVAALAYDELLLAASRRLRPLVLEHPESRTANVLREMALRVAVAPLTRVARDGARGGEHAAA